VFQNALLLPTLPDCTCESVYSVSMGTSPASNLGQSGKFYQLLIERAGLQMVPPPDPGFLSFLLMGNTVSVSLENPHYIQMFSVFDSAGTSARLSRNTFGGAADSSALLHLANQINLEAGGPVKVVAGVSDVRFEVGSFLFGGTSPARMGNLSLPDLTPGQVEPIFCEYLVIMAWVIAEFFQRAGRPYGGQPGLPEFAISVTPNAEGLNYFQRAFDEMGVTAKNAGTPDAPEFVFAIQGFHFRMKTPRRDGWHFVMTLPFLEERRFDVRSTAANVIRGILTNQFLHHCNRFNAERAGLKCGAFVEPGVVFVICAGSLPPLPRAQFAQLFPAIYNLLLGKAQKLFADAGFETVSFHSHRQRLGVPRSQ